MNFFSVFFSGDIVLSFVFIALLLMSILSWYVIFYKGIKLQKEYQFYKIFYKKHIDKKDWAKDLVDQIASNDLTNIINLSTNSQNNSLNFLLKEVKELQPILKNYEDNSARREILTMHLIQILDEIRFRLDHGLTILASIGSCAPFIGLFGTVWGIYHALGNIATQGNAGLNVVAGPISETLVATAFGLFCAIPAVLAYNSFVRLNRLLVQNLRHFAEQITTYTILNSK